MRKAVLLLVVTIATIGAGGASPQDDLLRARQLYNQQFYSLAIDSAATARHSPQLADTAGLIMARSLLERYRRESKAEDLAAARTELQQVRPAGLIPIDQIELVIALGELLYLDDQPGAAAEEFEMALDRVDPKNPSARERVLDWWASAIDRQAQTRTESERSTLYTRIVVRMQEELGRNTGSAVASYWLVAGARGSGDLDRAWDAAFAAWARAPLTGDGRTQLRADLEQIVTQAIIPERSGRQCSANRGCDARRVDRAQTGVGGTVTT